MGDIKRFSKHTTKRAADQMTCRKGTREMHPDEERAPRKTGQFGQNSMHATMPCLAGSIAHTHATTAIQPYSNGIQTIINLMMPQEAPTQRPCQGLGFTLKLHPETHGSPGEG